MTKHENELKEYLKRPESAEDKLLAVMMQLASELTDAEYKAESHRKIAEELEGMYEKAKAEDNKVFMEVYYHELQRERSLEVSAHRQIEALLRLVHNI